MVKHFTSAFFIVLSLSTAAVSTACSAAGVSKTVVESVAGTQEVPETGDQELLKDAGGSAVVSLWAGTMEAGFTDGDNFTARFLKPYGLCQAPGGGVLVVDCYSDLLRVSDGEKVATLAGNTDDTDGNGLPLGGYLNGSAEDALLNHPRFASASPDGTVVFSDTENHCIRLVMDGVVRLLAGEGTPGFADGNYDRARFNMPSGVAIGMNGVVYVADTLNHCIREISPEGIVSVLAGVPEQAGFLDGRPEEALFCEPNDIQLGADGALYVVDKGNQRIRRIVKDQVTTIAGSGTDTDSTTGYMIGGYRDGAASSAQFLYPTGIFAEENGTIYVADTGNHCIRSISADGMVTTIAGTKMPGNDNGSARSARFNQPLDVLYEEGCLYVSDSYNHAVRLINLHNEKGSGGS